MSLHFGHCKLSAPAKLNLMLHVTGRRADGYHDLQTIFHFLDFSDQLTFSTRSDSKIVLAPSVRGVDDEENLVFKAAKLLQEASGTELGATIRCQKLIPMGGGMGGGSSDAATTLVGLNQIWRTGFNKHDLLTIGASLGADVPIFIFGHSAWAEGKGERLVSMEIPERWYVVITPPCHVSTGDVFRHVDLIRDSPVTSLTDVMTHGRMRNDCQRLVCALYPDVEKAVRWLGAFGEARMTGTGSSVFAQFATHDEASNVIVQLPNGMTGFVSRGVNASPLYESGRVTVSIDSLLRNSRI